MKKTLTALLFLFNGVVAFPQTFPNRGVLAQPKYNKPLLLTRLDTLNNQRDMAKKVIPVAADSVDALYRHFPDAAAGNALLIINNKIIAGSNMRFDSTDVASFRLIKDGIVPKNIFNLSRYGVVLINLKANPKFEVTSLAAIKKFFNPKGKANFALNGYFIDDESLLIEKAAITRIDLFKYNPQNPLSAVTFNIWTINPDNRVVPMAEESKPNNNYVRGIASN